MKIPISVLAFIILFLSDTYAQDSIRFSGQVSSWVNLNYGNELPVWGGLRYIPQLNYSLSEKEGKMFDAELSVNINGRAGLHPFDSIISSGKIKPYRAWVRYSSDQFELRLGLQKINFGSASILRPLMWFDQLDPRDPLQLTDGVWGLLARYYFLNNANIWIWGLYGNNERRGWEIVPVNKKKPEFGGRIQIPVPHGEAGFSFHHRVADSRDIGGFFIPVDKIPENKFGFDAKWDLKAGIWIEGSFTNKQRNIGPYTNQLIFNTGIDYTFALGNGLYAAFEQLLLANDEKALPWRNRSSFSLMALNYPLGLSDKIGAIVYYNWSDNSAYNFVSWQRQFDKVILYVMGYWNPESYQLPSESATQNIFAGKGIQIMFVFNH